MDLAAAKDQASCEDLLRQYMANPGMCTAVLDRQCTVTLIKLNYLSFFSRNI